jgi:hypothetical protein
MADIFGSRSMVVPTPNPVAPTLGPSSGQPNYGQAGMQPTGAETGSDQTSLLKRAIEAKIYDSTPKKYAFLRLLMDKAVKYYGNDVFTYMEKTFAKSALKIEDNAGLTGSPATTGYVIVTTGSINNISLNKIVAIPNSGVTGGETKAMVTAVNTGTRRIDLAAISGNLPSTSQCANNSYMSVVSTVIADGMNFFMNYDRMSKIERYNFIQIMQRDKRWTRKDIQKFQNLGTTDYYDLDKKEQLDLVLLDMFGSFWNGQRGEVTVTAPGGTYKALTMNGIFPTMVAAGCATASGVTKSTLQDAFETYAFQTDYKSEGGTRYIFAQNAILYELSKAYKESGIRYTPSERTADLNLSSFKLGDMTFVPVATELFKDVSCFPATWQHRLFVLDLDTIQPVCMTGYQTIEMGETLNKQRGTTFDYLEWWVQGMLSLQMNNPLSSYYLDTTGIVSNWIAPQNP